MLQPAHPRAAMAIAIMVSLLTLDATSANLTSNPSPVLVEHKCSECVKEGRTSKVYLGGCMATLVSCGGGYYDEAGAYRPPQPCNTTSCSWECSNGHKGMDAWPSY